MASLVLPLLVSLDFDSDRALKLVVRAGGHILVVVLLAALALLLAQRLLTPVLRVAVREQMSSQPEREILKRVETLSHVVYTTLVVAVAVLAIVTILPEFGLDAAPLIAGLGLVGLAVGFGSQNLVKDVINGLFILVENQYGVGDVVRIAGQSGTVEDMNLRRTVLRDQDGAVHFVPHSQITTTTNLTKGFSRVNLDVHIAYDSDVDHAFQVIDGVGKQLAADADYKSKIMTAPHALRVEETGGGIVGISVVGVTQPSEQWAVASEMRRRLKSAFEAEGIRVDTSTPAATPAATPAGANGDDS